jgi:integrase
MPDFRRPPGPTTVESIRAALRAALTDACKQQLVTVNVAKLVNLPPRRRPKPKVWNPTRVAAWRKTGTVPGPVMVWTIEQTRAFLEAARGHPLYPLYLLIAHSGLRRGEAVGLRWEDTDFTTGIIEIRQQIIQNGWETEIAETKTEAGERTVIAVPAVLDALAAEQARQQHRRETAAAWFETGLVFTTDTGAPLHPSQATEQFQQLTKQADLPPIRLHDLRHGAATHALTAGVPLKTVSEMLGHSSYVITADTYTSVADEAKRAAAQAIADLLAGNANPTNHPRRACDRPRQPRGSLAARAAHGRGRRRGPGPALGPAASG